jgi:hypothetical protein
VTDQFGQAMGGAPVTWSVDAGGPGSINSAGLFTASNSNGTATIRATSGSATGVAGAAVTATNAAPTIVSPAAASGLTATTVNLSVLGNDDGGQANLVYYWSLNAAPAGATVTYSTSNATNAAKNTVATFNKVGTYTFLATISDGVNLTYSAVSVTTVQVAGGVTVSPGGVALAGLASYQFTAAVVDQFGQAMPSAAVTWSVDAGGPGSISANGLFTATNATGTATIRATSGSFSGTAGAAVTAVAPPPTNGVSVTTRAMTSFTELVITGSSGNDSIYVAQSGNTFSITANGATQSITGVFGDLVIKAGNGGSTITVDGSVHVNTLVYGGTGRDTIANRANGAYSAIVSLSGDVDTVSGNGVNTNYWADSGDVVNAGWIEQQAGVVNTIYNFYQPWSWTATHPDYVPMTLQGQNLRDPSDIGEPVHYPNHSLWGTGPVMADVRQYLIGDCFLMADLASMAYASPGRLTSVAMDLGDGTYVVRFKKPFQTNYYRVDGDFAAYQSLPTASGNIWAQVIEKAYAFARLGQNSYGSLNSGWMTNVSWDLGWEVDGWGGSTSPQSAGALAAIIDSANANHRGLTVGTGGFIWNNAPLIAGHAYTVIGYSVVNGVYMFQVRNPWGYDGAIDGSDPNDAIVSLTFAQFHANFDEIVQSA